MIEYKDNNGRSFQLQPIVNGTIRRARGTKGLEWLGSLDQVLAKLGDTVALADAISFLSGQPVETIDAGLAGEAIERAQDAIVEAFKSFCPPHQHRAIVQLVGKAREKERESLQQAETFFEQSSNVPAS